MVYGDGLENRCRRKTAVGSNPTPSATLLGVHSLAVTYRLPRALLKASGLTQFGSISPLKPAIRLAAAMVAILALVAVLALPI